MRAHFFLRIETSFFGNPFRLQGIFLLWHLLVFSMLSSLISFNRVKAWVFLLLLSMHFVVTVLFGSNAAARAVGSMGEPNALSSYLLFLWPFLWFAKHQFTIWKVSSRVIGLAVLLLIIFLSGSFSALFGFLVQSVFLIGKKERVKDILKYVSISLVIVMVSLILPFFERGQWNEKRSEIWQTAVKEGWYSPIFGAGFGNIEPVLKKASADLSNNVRFQFILSCEYLVSLLRG